MNLARELINADRQSPNRILVIGDCVLDTYVMGDLHQSCQEGCRKFVRKSHVVVPGGAANAARSIEAWNTEVKCIPGITPGIPSRIRFMDKDKCIFRYDDNDCNLDLNIVHDAAIEALYEWEPNAVLLSDYDRGVLPIFLIREIMAFCTKFNIPCVADCKRHPSIYCGAILKGNAAWKERYSDLCLRNDYEQYVITQGSYSPYGMYFGREWIVDPMPDVKCINYVGAGDCFAAHLTLALSYNFSLKEAAALAHNAARVYVQNRFNQPPELDEILRDSIQPG